MSINSFNHFKPTGYVMHHQFNIQQLYALPTLNLCVFYLSELRQWIVVKASQNFVFSLIAGNFLNG